MGNDSSKHGGQVDRKKLPLSLRSGPSSSTMRRHLENATKSRILQLKACGLKAFPEQIETVKDVIRTLDLSENKIKELPLSIGEFSNLKQLHLASNRLSSLPDEIGLLKALEVFNAASNLLTDLPLSFAGLRSLKTLNLSDNKFIKLPVVICHLPSLDTLHLANNFIEELPDEIKDLKASEVNLNQNRLSTLNPNLARCEKLRTLRVEENCLSRTAFTSELLSDSPVSLISYAGNLFQDKDFQNLPGYDKYQTRFTATKRKM
ncbi:hypothetical protein AB6A40_004920 [Gnathostoma spinigerum]|uniref:Disease resistance R13L4/SHOC-2-like LRR domain-containing protein n=1 Tax=Gnathostoma spinigerum TaxID=75299 RepID=A0ABD6EG94_9BILA